MTKLLKGKQVFVDTTEFSDAHFNVRNPSFAEFRKLCEDRQLTFLTTDITKREIKAGIKSVADQARQRITDAAKAIHSLQEPEVPAMTALVAKLEQEVFSDAWSTALDEFFVKCHALTLPIPPTAIPSVLDLYFERRPPFGAKSKKAEFPDAFVLQALEAAIRPNGDCLYVISNDSDFEAACNGHSKLIHMKSLSRLLGLVHGHDAAVKQIHKTIQKNRKVIEAKLEDILKSLPPELRDAEGAVRINSIRLDDIFDELIVSCDGETAAVDFVCNAEVDALLEFASSQDLPEFRSVNREEVINITLVFQFDPQNADFFEVLEIWSPAALSFW